MIQHPRYVDTEKCIACGLCASKCPKKVADSYNERLVMRKAIYVPYSQAVPLKFAIDADNCIYFTKGKCRACEKLCPSGAIDFDEKEKNVTLHVGAIILAPGFKAFDPGGFENYAYADQPNVVTSLEFERILSATGPFSGHLIKPSDKSHRLQPQKIAWIQCVGSRDMNRCDHGYCSSVCCMYAVKQSLIAKDHSASPLDCAIFYMDLRTQGKDFHRYYETAKKKGVRFICSRIHSVSPVMGSDDLVIRYVEETGAIKEEVFNMVVLSTGLEIGQDVVNLSKRLEIDLDRYQFVQSDSLHPAATSVKGIYACGAFTGPKDIPQSVMEASAAACVATERLAPVRNTQTKFVKSPAERDVTRESPRIGVFVCNCGINIGGVINVPEVAKYARTLPHVVYVEKNLFTCSQDTQNKLAQVIQEKRLNRVVIAACTPRTHEGLFQETLKDAGLNKYLLEMANIRNHDSWVHADNPDAATQKAKDLVRMTVAKTALLGPLVESELPISRSALVVGGGIAGMTAALSLSHHGFPVHLVEHSETLGGNAKWINHTYTGETVSSLLANLIDEVQADVGITVHLGTTVGNVEGFVGNFKTNLIGDSTDTTIKHGVAILATGAKEYKPKEYLYGQHNAVVTQLELDRLLRDHDSMVGLARDVAFIQCVGSRDEAHPYCSKVCCTHSIKNALEFKTKDPKVNVYVIYRDIRTYGKREDLYREARARGVLFFRYLPDEKPTVTPDGNRVQVEFRDHILDRRLRVCVDILCLATALEPNRNQELNRTFKVPVDGDGWLLEAHQKLRPVDFTNEGVFLCGMAHYPKPIEESVAQAQAAASRALSCLAANKIRVGGLISHIDPKLCSGCLACMNVCPYGAISFNKEKKAAEVNPALCKGCGACAAACPSEASVLMGFNNRQLLAQIKSALAA